MDSDNANFFHPLSLASASSSAHSKPSSNNMDILHGKATILICALGLVVSHSFSLLHFLQPPHVVLCRPRSPSVSNKRVAKGLRSALYVQKAGMMHVHLRHPLEILASPEIWKRYAVVATRPKACPQRMDAKSGTDRCILRYQIPRPKLKSSEIRGLPPYPMKGVGQK